MPWDPALGKMPESVIAEPVGQRAVRTAIVTNSVVMASKMGAFVATGSASVLSEVIHSIADLGNQCLLAVGERCDNVHLSEIHMRRMEAKVVVRGDSCRPCWGGGSDLALGRGSGLITDRAHRL